MEHAQRVLTISSMWQTCMNPKVSGFSLVNSGSCGHWEVNCQVKDFSLLFSCLCHSVLQINKHLQEQWMGNAEL